MTSNKQHNKWLAAAKQLGQDHANNAASWVCNGNSDPLERGRVLAMMNNGDPAVFDYLPRMPDLSGEFADELTPHRLAEYIIQGDLCDINYDPTLIDELSDAYMEGVSDTFETACEIELIQYLDRMSEGHATMDTETV